MIEDAISSSLPLYNTSSTYTGMIFALPEAPIYPDLQFQNWTSSVPLSSSNYTIVGNQPVTICAVYEPIQDAIIIPMNIPANATISFNYLNRIKSIDWGDGTISTSLSTTAGRTHTYTHTDDSLLRKICLYGVTDMNKDITSDNVTQSLITTIYFPGSLENLYGMASCVNLGCVVLAKGVPKIKSYAFKSCTSLTHIIIPDSVISIGVMAFYNCTNLNNIILPDNVINIEGNAFVNTAYYNDLSNWENNLLYIGNYLINSKGGNATYTIKPGTKLIAGGAFYENTKLTSITIPKSVTHIGPYAFQFSNNLASVIYQGTAEEWANISIGESNETLTAATITFAG